MVLTWASACHMRCTFSQQRINSCRLAAASFCGVFPQEGQELQRLAQRALLVMNCAVTPPAYSSMIFCKRNMNMRGLM